jgi:hypothetical protein
MVIEDAVRGEKLNFANLSAQAREKPVELIDISGGVRDGRTGHQ